MFVRDFVDSEHGVHIRYVLYDERIKTVSAYSKADGHS